MRIAGENSATLDMQNDRAGSEESLDGLNLMNVLHESLLSAVIMVDEHQRISLVNPEAESLLGLRASKLCNQPLELLPTPLRDVILETFSTTQPQTRQLRLQAHGADESRVHVSTSIPHAKKGFSCGVIAVLTDLAFPKRLEQRMRHLDRLASIGTLAASMAHEIKNALVAVRTFTELLIRQNKDAELADIVNGEIRRIDSMVSQMLSFSGPAKPIVSTFHLHDLLEHSLRLIGPQLAGKNIQLKKSLAAATDLTRGDGHQLEQAFLNLFFNAIEAMGSSGELSIATDLVPLPSASPTTPGVDPKTQLRLSLKNSGAGIPPDQIPRLFEPFFTTKKDGTGLGLSITRRIIQEHRGTIHVESDKDHGTTFFVLLPSASK